MKIDAPTTPVPQAQKADAAAKTAAKQLEAFFLRQILAEARPQGTGIDGGFAGDTFKQMLDEAVADKMAAAGGLGMASMFQKQLGGTPGAMTHQMMPGELGPSLDGLPQLQMPVPGRVGFGYGPRVGHTGEVHQHQGLDLTAHMGDPVAAAAAGTVIHAGPGGNYGNLVTVRHGDGVETRYAHLSAIGVKVGDTVSTGQVLGNVGSTGLSDGPHLHFELRREGQAIDPAPLLPLNRSGFRTNR
ncbi:MAG: peptidoglycan DD-metalloendopeptidase family protein [Kofleriaceae bacterium]